MLGGPDKSQDAISRIGQGDGNTTPCPSAKRAKLPVGMHARDSAVTAQVSMTSSFQLQEDADLSSTKCRALQVKLMSWGAYVSKMSKSAWRIA
jgi:hypothetical protein